MMQFRGIAVMCDLAEKGMSMACTGYAPGESGMHMVKVVCAW